MQKGINMSDILYKSPGYELTRNHLTYQGHKEILGHIRDLRVIENTTKKIVFNGVGWAVLMLGIAAYLAPIFGDYAQLPIWFTRYVLPVGLASMGFFIYFIRSKKFSLEIEKANGNKGEIGHANTSTSFDSLVAAFKEAKIQASQTPHT
jgi:hypothetical protein